MKHPILSFLLCLLIVASIGGRSATAQDGGERKVITFESIPDLTKVAELGDLNDDFTPQQLSFNTDSTLVGVSYTEGGMDVWDIASQTIIAHLDTDATVMDLTFVGATNIAYVTTGSDIVQVWDTVASVTSEALTLGSEITALEFSPVYGFLVGTADGWVKYWDTLEGEADWEYQFEGLTILHITVAAEATPYPIAVSGCLEYTEEDICMVSEVWVEVIVEGGSEFHALPEQNFGEIEGLAYAPQWLILSHQGTGDALADSTIRFWDPLTSTKTSETTIDFFSSPDTAANPIISVEAMAISPDMSMVSFLASNFGTVTMMQIQGEDITAETTEFLHSELSQTHPYDPQDIEYSPDGTLLGVVSGNIIVWGLE